MRIKKYFITSLRYFVVIFFLIVSFVFSNLVLAAQVGFVPATGIWFSRTELSLNESVRIYTVVINNTYYELNGVVAFYDNQTIIDTISFTSLKNGEARQLSVFWQPSKGDHTISARFTKAEAVDERGKKTIVSLDSIVGTTGQSLTLKNGETSEVGAAALSVEQNNGRLLLTPLVRESSLSTVSLGQNSSSSITGIAAEATDVFAKNRALLDKAESAAGTITSTAQRIEDAVNSVKAAVAQGSQWYGAGKDGFQKVQPIFRQIYNGWLVVSNNNDSIRILVIVVVVVVGWWVVRRLRRRQRFYDDR
ncbi:MAG: hypothetical protein A3I29_04430 [Candidatus Magasanikbacteria bacterium RIFCSPLOWO2_02_FULL_44_11]|uniref:Uncharacterized protein n=1 Tax=Candidatus Magasanikbacteria bacterium RIFCSPLOWO2_02_FULL_44_11 TaxID=1798689 RepID=A0A1F6NBE6_9BACT|nr:MAG: hypothetical protein A3I29_04430 [Candidatus Magasanikbacteria bacterium RIFCSPLOWO2_02_FULL_44_11]